MSQYTKYRLYKQQRRRNTFYAWEDVMPGVYSPDADGTMPLVVIEDDSPDCGYDPGDEPLYKWVDDGTICVNCE